MNFKPLLLLGGAVLALTSLTSPAQEAAPPAPQVEQAGDQAAQPEDEFTKLVNSISWKLDGKGQVGHLAEITVPEGYRYTDGPGTIKMMEAYGNLTSGGELGYLSPLNMEWFAVFEFDKVGYVKDDEKDNLDADAIMKQMEEGQAHANTELTKRGMPTLILEGWHTKPFYNPETKNLEWAIRLRSSDGGQVVNYKTKLLGRRGVMDVVLVCDEARMSTIIPEYQKVLTGFSFKKDESYAAFTEGDKVAEFGLTGLIVGGGLLAAAKTGLLAKLWKPIAAGLVGIGVLLKRIFVGKTKESI